jgi:hypothetical protein
MARYNEILVGRFNRLLQKLLGLKGGPPAPQLASDIGPTFEIEQVAVENRYPLTVDSFQTTNTNTGVAAQFSTLKLRNPVGSNVIAVFEKITLATSSADTVTLQIGTDQTDGGLVIALVSANNLDTRSGRLSTLIFSRSQNAAPVSQVAIATVSATTGTNYDFIAYQNQEITLNPGRCIQLGSGTATLTISGSFKWRERLLEESERA